MANNFPPIPSDLALASLEYDAAFGSTSQPGSASALMFDGTSVQFGGVFGALGGGSAVLYTFSTPGSFGSFDQTTAETIIAKVLTDACQVLADLTGIAQATIQSAVTITRRWTWIDTNGNRAAYADTMTYPPAT